MVLKKPVPMDSNFHKVPQSSGISGWICLTYNENLKPVCLWITNQDSIEISCCIDERLFGDTFFKAEKIGNKYIIADLFLLNSNCIFKCTNYEKRSSLIENLFEKFYTPIKNFPELIPKSKFDFTGIKLKGYELYTAELGTKGYFVENTKPKIIKSDIPDVYFIEGTENYLRVPDLKTSEFLRLKGLTFELDCEDMQDGTFLIKENIL